MNNALSREIIKHILYNFLILPSNLIDTSNFQSLCNDNFLLQEKLSFLTEEGKTINNKIWGCSLSFLGEEVRILLGDCSQGEDKELCMIIWLSSALTYGLYIPLSRMDDNNLIACLIDQKNWMPCNTFLQATFLSGMEQLKETFAKVSLLDNYNEQYKILLSLIKFYNSLYEEILYEGQEN